MRSRIRALLQLRLHHLYVIEATLIGVFFVQALRFVVGSVYSRVSSATLVSVLNPESINPAIPGIVEPGVVSNELAFLVYAIAVPLLLALVVGRVPWLFVVATAITAAGRTLMVAGTEITVVTGASLAVGGGLLYIAMIIRYRASLFPLLFILGLSIDQLFRAVGNTLDPSWSLDYYNIQLLLSIVVVALSLIAVLWHRRQTKEDRGEQRAVSPDHGLLPFWSGLALGALLFLELSLLALPNAIAGRADVDYTSFVPAVMVATLLPLLPWVRQRARNILEFFDSAARGWVWMLVIALLLVGGLRFSGAVAGALLVMAQLLVNLMWWWLVRPRAEKERNLSSLWLPGTMGIFTILSAFDLLTYEYGFVRNLAPGVEFLDNVVTPLLRGFRGMGLAVLLFSIFVAALPMVMTRRRIPWPGGTLPQSLLVLLLVVGMGVSASLVARPPLVAGVRGVESIRVGTYNIHGGFTEFFGYDLEGIARTIQRSGASTILLQEVEKGRMISFGVDQALWLARRLGMDTRFYPTNEGLQGLAVLSSVPIGFDDGKLLTSTGQQTGVQFVQVLPDVDVVVTLYNTWLGFLLEPVGDQPVDDREQQQQLSEILGLIDRQHRDGTFALNGVLGRTVIGGTFNNIPDSPLVETMKSTGFNDPHAGLPVQIGATLQRTGQRARFDYLWLRNLPSIGQGVVDTSASDHRMAFVEVELTRRGN